MTIKGSLLVIVPIVKRFSAENFRSPAKTDSQNGGFSRKCSLAIRFWLQDPQKAHPCAEPRLLTYFT